MSLLYGLKSIMQSTDESKPHILGYQTARAGANAILLDIWNAATSAGRKFTLDLDGKPYSAAWTAGDLLYAVTGGITGVRRLDSLAIGAAGSILRSSGTAPAWSTATFPLTAVAGAVLYASATNVWSGLALGTARQVLQVNAGATAPEWTSDLSVATLTLAAGSTTNALVVTTTGAITSSFRYDGTHRIDLSVLSTGAGQFRAVGDAGAGFILSSVDSGLIINNDAATAFLGFDNAAATLTHNDAGNTLTLAGAILVLPATTSSFASARLPHGTAPTSPVNGDMWTTTAGLFVRINGSTVGPLS